MEQDVHDNGEVVAVKKLYNLLGLDDGQFKNELLNLMRVQHPNIIRLVGYCSETRDVVVEHNGKLILASMEERALCLEYMHGGTLDKLISGNYTYDSPLLIRRYYFACLKCLPTSTDESSGLDWGARYKVIKGICKGLKHLHTGSKDPIYHLDLKPANILLDKDMTPKIGDFGMSRLFGSGFSGRREGV